MLNEKVKNNCTGCGLCEQICPLHAIKLQPDLRTGFLYPRIDHSVCTECGLCEKLCPQLDEGTAQQGKFRKEIYGVIAKDNAIRNASTSGGIFSVLALSILRAGGAVAGAAFDNELSLRHILIHDEAELPKIMGSKYLQSDIRPVYQDIKSALQQGKRVLFCGTPCQVSAIKKFCAKCDNADRLILIDLLCRGVPSPKAFQTYLKQISDEAGSRVVAIYSKDKTYGWRSLGTRFDFQDGRTMIESRDDCDLGKSYICYDYCTRDSCFSCKYKSEERVSDITIGDFWGVNDSELDDNKGTSAVLINTQVGSELFSKITSDIIYKRFMFQDLYRNNTMAFSPLRENTMARALFWELLKTHDYRTTVRLVRECEAAEEQKKDAEMFQIKRLQKKFELLYKWMQMKQQGRSFLGLLDDRNISSVAIYGMGEIGILLYNELKLRPGFVHYIVDKNAAKEQSKALEVPVYAIDDSRILPVDAVIITPVLVTDEIKELIAHYMGTQKVLDIGEILYKIEG